jgi:hypothetical protein
VPPELSGSDIKVKMVRIVTQPRMNGMDGYYRHVWVFQRESEPENKMDYQSREKLITKLRTLIAVLRVAEQKVVVAMEDEAPGTEEMARMNRIRNKLARTYQTCAVALRTLEDNEIALSDVAHTFPKSHPITPAEIAAVDWDDLLGKL